MGVPVSFRGEGNHDAGSPRPEPLDPKPYRKEAEIMMPTLASFEKKYRAHSSDNKRAYLGPLASQPRRWKDLGRVASKGVDDGVDPKKAPELLVHEPPRKAPGRDGDKDDVGRCERARLGGLGITV